MSLLYLYIAVFQITSPATVEVSNHTENVKSVGTDSSNVFTDKIDMSGGLMSWLTKTVTESKLLSDVAEKAKAGVETVMTTLDPGMKPFLAEHGVVSFWEEYKFERSYYS